MHLVAVEAAALEALVSALAVLYIRELDIDVALGFRVELDVEDGPELIREPILHVVLNVLNPSSTRHFLLLTIELVSGAHDDPLPAGRHK